MSHHLEHLDHIDTNVADCVAACSDCHDVCLATVQHSLAAGAEHARPEQIRVMLDCAQACETSRDFMLRGSDLHAATCGVCAEACQRCAETCEQLDGPAMEICAEACRRCAESCRSMAGAAA